jgi:hypothetical protein
MLMFEYSTADNFRRNRLMRKKLTAYRKHLPSIETWFDANGRVLFVFDAPRHRVKSFVRPQGHLDDPFYYVDLKSFMDVQIGGQLTAPIYFWGGDGRSCSLTKDA